MPDDEPLGVAENVLRDLIKDVLAAQHGEAWHDHLGVTAERRAKWEERRVEERKRRTGGVADERLLYYADFTDLKTIIGNDTNWALFKDCFGVKKVFDVYLDRLGALRNPGAHSRALMDFERNLIIGMTGELRQKVAIYRSGGGGGPEPEHFPRIDEVRDSYGHTTPGAASAPVTGHMRTGLTLRPGDRVSFYGAATDPEDRPLHWRIHFDPIGVMHTANGPTLEFEWVVEERHIGESRWVLFWLESDRPYHRSGHIDDSAAFQYHILPPRP